MDIPGSALFFAQSAYSAEIVLTEGKDFAGRIGSCSHSSRLNLPRATLRRLPDARRDSGCEAAGGETMKKPIAFALTR